MTFASRVATGFVTWLEDRDEIESNRRSIKHTSTIVGPSIICHVIAVNTQTFQHMAQQMGGSLRHGCTQVRQYVRERIARCTPPLSSRQAYHHTPQYAENGSWELEESGTMCKMPRVSTCRHVARRRCLWDRTQGVHVNKERHLQTFCCWRRRKVLKMRYN